MLSDLVTESAMPLVSDGKAAGRGMAPMHIFHQQNIEMNDISPPVITDPQEMEILEQKPLLGVTNVQRMNVLGGRQLIKGKDCDATGFSRFTIVNQKGHYNPPTGSMKGTPLHIIHTKMSGVLQDALIPTPPALLHIKPLGAHYKTDTAHMADMIAQDVNHELNI